MSATIRLCKATTLILILFGMASTIAQGAMIDTSPGPQTPCPQVLNLTESSGTDPVPLFGTPTFRTVEPGVLTADFNPTGFVAYGTRGEFDVIDGQLNFTLACTDPTTAIHEIEVFESGDRTLLATGTDVGTAATRVLAMASIRVKILEVDGVLLDPVSGSEFDRVVFSLPNQVTLLAWNLSFNINLDSILDQAGIFPTVGATKVDVVIDNSLVAMSEPETLAFIAKKDFVVAIDTGPQTPEPGTMALLAVALCGLALRQRQRMAR